MKAVRRRSKLATGDLPGVGELLRELSLPEEMGELAALADLCRRSLRVRAWLFGRFAVEPASQAAFRRFLADPASPLPWRAPPGVRPAHFPPGKGPYGGLSEARVLALIKGYQAGSLDLTAFVLVRLWRRILGSGRTEIPFALQAATARYWAALARDRSGRKARDLARVLGFFRHRGGRPIGEADFGHPCSWKIHVLLYLLDHPRDRYKLAELRAALAPKYRQVDGRELRRFWRRHGIRRDPSPGRPPGPLSRPKIPAAKRSLFRP